MQLTSRIVAALVLPCICYSVTAQKKALTDNQYFKSDFKGIVQSLSAATRWIDNTHFLLLKDSKTFVVDAKTGAEREAGDADKTVTKEPAKTTAFIKNANVFAKVNDVEIQLTNDPAPEVNPTVSPDGNYVAYTKKNDLYTVNIATKKETRLTNDGTDVILNGYASWVYMEEILGRATAYKAYWWSPDSKHIAYFRSDENKVPEFIITDGPGLHGVVEKTRYPKVGDPNPEVKVGIVSPDGGATVWSDFNEKDDQYFGMPYWKPDGSALLVQWMNRLQNNLVIYEVNLTTGAKKEFYNETQKTWIELENKRLTFLKNGKGLILQSDATGWSHLYNYDMNGKLLNAITSGKFTVTDVNYIDEKNNLVYFCARSRENTAHKDFYKVGLNGKGLTRLSFGDFSHVITSISPDGSYFITNYSNVSTPARLALVSNKGKIIKELGNAKAAEFDSYELAKTEFLRVKSDDGLYDLPMKVTWPVNMDKNKKYPVLISIYGGPDAGNCNDTWTLSGNQQFYAKEGLIQVVMDHRASGHFGKEGVNYMYHNLGYWEMKDYSTMVKWLIANGNADPTKICITGFSYGGYMSCYALTYGADVFTHGMAGGSVVDWTLYDSHYTERFMGTPANNPEGYKTSSVLTYADKLKGKLQLVHGIVDDNVHLQNSIQLSSKLQDLKKDFEEMFYSGGRHGWGGNKGAHFANLKTKFIYKYLLEKDVPAGMLR
ncbi:S9 family peptidase [Ferruginibacter sp. HRS2-29]|uniref:S9 family peptidase n=1 Tax=Ferruginibacter sp. HRS2-29 TaxID=2487334 RepID=UPI0020CFB08B|nr:S9 family peptidase [Ferruginibacter sp. HRS2-29]MCP9750126.1 S9 family peptidase [Ferruginibacter sp. HRS2-29]